MEPGHGFRSAVIGTSLPETLIGLHFLAAGAQSTITRMAARRRISDDTIVYLSAASTVLIAGTVLIFILLRYPGLGAADAFPGTYFLTLCGLFLGIGLVYSLVSRLRYKSQSLLPSFIHEPLSRLHVFIVVPIAIVFLEDGVTARELTAIGLAFSAILLIGFVNRSGTARADPGLASGLMLLLIAGVFAAGLQLLAKVLMAPEFGVQIPVLVYILGSNIVTTLVASASHLGAGPRVAVPGLLLFGIGAGICNTVALGSLLYFLIDGKASRIYSVAALSMLIPVAFNVLGKHERRPRAPELFALACAMGAIILQTTGGES